jgi:hypothetical protein
MLSNFDLTPSVHSPGVLPRPLLAPLIMYIYICVGNISCPAPVILPRLSWPGFPVPVILSLFPVPSVLPQLSCTSYPVPDVMSRLSCLCCPDQTVLSWISRPVVFSSCPVLVIIFAALSSPVGPLPAVLPRLSCPRCHVLYVMFLLSFYGCPDDFLK